MDLFDLAVQRAISGGGSGGSLEPITVTFKVTSVEDEQRIKLLELFANEDGDKAYQSYTLDSDISEITALLYAFPYFDEYYTCFCAIGNTSNISNYTLPDGAFNQQYGPLYDDENDLYINFGQLIVKDGDTFEITIAGR